MLSTATELWSPQGVVTLGERDANGPTGVYFDIGDCPQLSTALTVEQEIVKESTTGQRLDLARLEKGKTAEVTLQLRSLDDKTLALLMRSTVEAVTGSTVSDELSPTTLAVDDIVKLSFPFVSSVTITDSAGSPATLTAGTHYTLDADSGMYRIVDLASFTLPLKASYTYAAHSNAAMFTGAKLSYELVFSGVNTARSNSPARVELYKVEFDPANNLPFVTNEAGLFELKGSMLVDDTKDATDATYGPFGRVMRKA